MSPNHNARHLLGDLLIPLAALLCIGVILAIEQLGYRSTNIPWHPDTFLDQDRWEELYANHNPEQSNSGRSALLVAVSNESDSLNVCQQYEYVLSSMFVDTSVHIFQTHPIDEDNAAIAPIVSIDLCAYMPTECTDVILCTSALKSSWFDTDTLSQWVSKGGHLIIANGLECEELPESWHDLLGIASINNPEDQIADSLYFETAFLAGAKGREFSSDVINCTSVDVRLQPDCLIHITTDDHTHPLLWEHSYGKGQVLVCNADLMSDKTDRGIIAASFASLGSAFVYPVINAAVYCIDDFPSVAPAGYDSNILSQFGYTVEDYYVNVWWPSMQRLAQKYDLRYSAFLIQCYESNVHGPFNNRDHQSSAAYYAQQLLELRGEIGLHGYNHQPLVLEGYTFDEKNDGYTSWPNTERMMEAVQAGIEYTQSLYDDIHVQAYVAPSNVLSREAMNTMIRRFEDIRIYAGVYVGTPDQLVQEFSVLDEDVVQVPRLTADMQMEDSEWWLQINELNYHFYESNFIHPDDILDEERTDGGDFFTMLESYEQMIQWNKNHHLRTCTISDAAGAVQRYCLATVSQQCNAFGMDIQVDHLVDSIWLMLRTKHTPRAVSGCQIIPIDEGCYVLEITEEHAKIKWETAK